MIEIVSWGGANSKAPITLNNEQVTTVVESVIGTIKKELPEEAQTVEVLEYIVSEISQSIKEKKIAL